MFGVNVFVAEVYARVYAWVGSAVSTIKQHDLEIISFL